MWTWLNDHLLGPVHAWLLDLVHLLLSNLLTIAGFILALIVIRRVLMEKRSPANFFAWFFFVVLVPVLGVPLYLVFGGRKSRRLIRSKQAILEEAASMAKQVPDPPTAHDILAYDLTSASTTGNHCELLPDGEAAFARLCREIRQAEHTIHIATFILSEDDTGRSVVELLTRRAREGITVRLLLDSLGSWLGTRRARRRIRQAGGHVAMFIPVMPFQSRVSTNLRNHRKIAVFDNACAITGGQNIDRRFMGAAPNPDCFTDFSLVTYGPAVAQLNRIFIADWAFCQQGAGQSFPPRTEPGTGTGGQQYP